MQAFYVRKKYRKIPKIGPRVYIFQRPFLSGLYTEGKLRFKIGQAYTGREICISKSIGLAYSWKKIYASNLQKGGLHLEVWRGLFSEFYGILFQQQPQSPLLPTTYFQRIFANMPTFKPLLFKRNLVLVLPRMSAGRLLLTRPKRGGAYQVFLPSPNDMSFRGGVVGEFPRILC